MFAISVLQKLRRYSRRRSEKSGDNVDPALKAIAHNSEPALPIETVFARLPQPYRLHIACGNVKLQGWVNVDRDPVSEIVDASWDVRQPLPIADCSCQYIFHEHFLEHLTVPEGLSFLRECRRLLIPGGVLRVAMPDLAECVRQYYEHDWRQPWMQKYGYEWIQTRAEMINIAFRDWEHKWLYDREELHRRLREAGFEQIRDCERLQSPSPALRDLETRDETLLVCEAIK